MLVFLSEFDLNENDEVLCMGDSKDVHGVAKEPIIGYATKIVYIDWDFKMFRDSNNEWHLLRNFIKID